MVIQIDQASGLRERVSAAQTFSPVHVVAVSSGKGGVGKTNIVANLAVAGAKKGFQVMIMDADLALGNLDVLLGLTPAFTLEDVISGRQGLEDIVVLDKKLIAQNPITHHVASISVGVYQGIPIADLDYPEDSGCETDMNIVMNDAGGFIEIQGTAEGAAFSEQELQTMLNLGKNAIATLIEKQHAALK